MDETKQLLLKLLKENAFQKGKRILSSGKESNYYLDLKKVTLTSEGAYLTAKLILELLKKERIDAIGGPTLGADPIIGAIAALAYIQGRAVNTFIVRKEPKKHGMEKFIEGPPISVGDKIVIIEDVVTTGSSVLKAVEAVRETGGQVTRIITLVDRLEGAAERLRKEGCRLVPIFTSRDFGINP